MKHRLISASIALPIVLSGILLGGIWFSFIIVFGAVVSAYELAKMTGTDHRKTPFISAILSGILVLSVYMYSRHLLGTNLNSWELQLSALSSALLILVLVSILMLLVPVVPGKPRKLNKLFSVLSAVGYTGGLLSFSILVRNGDNGLGWIVLLSLIVWANDTGSYITGKALGRTPFFPSISPNKTREGAIGGYFLGMVVAIVAGIYLSDAEFTESLLFRLILMGIIFVSLAQIGDLFESALKRRANIKDSGSIMPGHGGALDRLDSIVLAFPVLYYFTQ
ncbi:MAG: phosphatidate cytidylyltransferase [Dehalococcoidia bacterium]|tara:strand:- start:1627 stop:2463 length:837 start_codon:yes stop_codon:yes gene_type:complete